MTLRRGLLVLGAAAFAVSGCQSTQDKSAEIAASLGPVKLEEGLKITKESTDVEVLDTTLLTDKYGSAVVVELRNTSDQDLVNIPIAIDVRDASGKTVYKNDIPGIEPALAGMPYLEAGAEGDWVHNQVLATGKPTEVKVTVGQTDAANPGELPDIEVGPPEIGGDPVSGIEATGPVVNNTDERQDRVLFYGVARNGDEVVAAGRAAIDHINAGRRLHYNIFFVGDPGNADVSVTSFPTIEPN